MPTYEDTKMVWNTVVNTMDELLILLDRNLRITFMNKSALQHLNVEADTYLGMTLPDIGVDRFNEKLLRDIMHTRKPLKNFTHETFGNKHFSISISPLTVADECIGLHIIALNVTDYIDMEHELDVAFALSLPDTKIEFKLRSTLEYRDVYDPETGNIRITEVIPDGGYRHVVNCLRIFSALRAKGVTKIIGIDKDIIVPALIMHDIGKSQPILNVGEVVNPREVFECGHYHAERSAEIAKEYYGFCDDIVAIIRHHHNREDELPNDFPWRLRPAWRLFQLIDGLSASITRGGGEIAVAVYDCIVQVTEVSPRPEYNGIWHYDLFHGTKERVTNEFSIETLSVPVIGQVARYRHL